MTMRIRARRALITFNILCVGSFLLLTSACSEVEFTKSLAQIIAERLENGTEQPSYPSYVVGQPYEISGTRYQPAEDYSYVATGIASWYGPEFHGKRTVIGEVFDMDQITAAHRTLPVPSLVRVINLENGRSLLVRINDRGPFLKNRLIDVSRRGAQLLGFGEKGTAPVRVEIVAEASRRLKREALTGSGEQDDQPSEMHDPLDMKALAADRSWTRSGQGPFDNGRNVPKALLVGGMSETMLPVQLKHAPRMYVRVASFKSRESAIELRSSLETHGPVLIVANTGGDREYFQVRLGPFANVSVADAALDSIHSAQYIQAEIIVD